MTPLDYIYVIAFGGTAFVCLFSAIRAREIDDSAVSMGFVSLLALSGGWALSQLFILSAPGETLKTVSHVSGLVLGLATVGAWLYFTSAYTGKDYHKNPIIRRVAVAVYLLIVGLKVTNPIHGLYYTTTYSAEAGQLFIEVGPLHLIVLGIAYALSSVGLYQMFELFYKVEHETSDVLAVGTLLVLPAGFTLLGHTQWVGIRELSYEPIGVALFTLGVYYGVKKPFIVIPRVSRRQFVSQFDNPVIFLDRDQKIWDYNEAAEELFTDIESKRGRLAEELKECLVGASSKEKVLEFSMNGRTKKMVRNRTVIESNGRVLGAAILLADVTRLESQRQEVERQNEHLDGFAEAIAHELRNSTQMMSGYIGLASGDAIKGDTEKAMESLEKAEDAMERTVTVIEDLTNLAQLGQTLADVYPVTVSESLTTLKHRGVCDDLAVRMPMDGVVEGDPERITHIIEKFCRVAEHRGATELSVAVEPDRIVLTDNDEPLTESQIERAFDYGSAIPDSEAGMALPMIKAFSRVQGWDAMIDATYTDGLRIVLNDVVVRATDSAVDFDLPEEEPTGSEITDNIEDIIKDEEGESDDTTTADD